MKDQWNKLLDIWASIAESRVKSAFFFIACGIVIGAALAYR